MADRLSHRPAKKRGAEPGGQTEVPLASGKRVAARIPGGARAVEVELSGTPQALAAATSRLKRSAAPHKVLRVPQKHMDAAAKAMREAGVGGIVKNMRDTQRRSVRQPE